jgi:tRNA (cmo5U34)-methyltransferase
MLNVAKATLGASLADHATLHHGLIDVAPSGPFDAATCILTLHIIERDERLRTLHEVHRRLKPGAPFAVAHFSFPQTPEGRDRWLARYAAFAISNGVAPEQMAKARSKIGEELPILSPEGDEQLLRDDGFGGVELFYVGFAFRGWVAYA